MNKTENNKSKVILRLMQELKQTGINIRGDWSGFDGRELLRALDIWLLKLAKVEGLEYTPYYNDVHRWGDDLFKCDISKRFESD